MILIGLGSNLISETYGSPKNVLIAAIEKLQEAGVILGDQSSWYETEPIPRSDQAWYVNAVIRVMSDLAPKDLLSLLHDIEQDMGRIRRIRWEARVIDLDLLAYDEVVLPDQAGWQATYQDKDNLNVMIPHARLHQRQFVLDPLYDVAPAWQHPVFQKSVTDLRAECPKEGVVRRFVAKS